MSTHDAIVIPGGGLLPSGQPPPWVENRLDRALQLYNGAYLMTLSAGTTHKPPPLDESGFPILEAIVNARYLHARGIPRDRLLAEACSYDTIGNAYFSRLLHAEPARLHRLLIITSAFHMPRTESLFRWVYGMEPTQFDLSFATVPDTGIDASALHARREREAQSLARLQETMQHVTTLTQLHRWLFTEHNAYTIARTQSDPGEAKSTY